LPRGEASPPAFTRKWLSCGVLVGYLEDFVHPGIGFLAIVSPSAFSLDTFLSSLDGESSPSTFSAQYHNTHRLRFEETCRLINVARRGKRAIEIGATDFFQVALGTTFGFSEVWGTVFDDKPEHKFYTRAISAAGHTVEATTVSVDVERELFPVTPGYFDLVMFCEVLEHMDIDPMFALSEFNRILPVGGQLIITTPNCCSARNTWKILQGYRPHFFMQYEKSRSPYRHNFEYDVHAVAQLVGAAGFHVDRLYTLDVFEAPLPEALEFLRRNHLPTDHRGDGIFMLATKTGPVTDRWPYGMYV
jgi:SAM-dependent methyltransferase